MDEPTAARWAERAVRAVNRAYPDVEFETWPLCDRLQAHAQLAAGLGLETAEAGRLLNQAAIYSWRRGRYGEAEPLFQRSLAICEKVHGPEHPDVATTLNNLRLLYRDQGRLEEAEPLFQRSLAIWEKALGPEHPNVAGGLGNYAVLLRKMAREAEAAEVEARARELRAPARRTKPLACSGS